MLATAGMVGAGAQTNDPFWRPQAGATVLARYPEQGAQAHGTMKLLFNAIFTPAAVAR